MLTVRGAVLSVNASQWEVAQAVHDILVKETFKEDFETEEKFADFIGISRSNCYFDTLTKEEIVRVLNYMNKQKIGDSEELKEVIEAWK